MDKRFQLRVPLEVYKSLRLIWDALDEGGVKYWEVPALDLIKDLRNQGGPLLNWLQEVDEEKYLYAVSNSAFMLDLPFKGDVILKCLTEDLIGCDILTNVPRSVIHHSPSGHCWGYRGSGPHDLALDILCQYYPLPHNKEGVKCQVGECSKTAWLLHHDFCLEVISPLDGESSHRIKKEDILTWLQDKKTIDPCKYNLSA